MKDGSKLKLSLMKSVLFGLSIPVFCIWLLVDHFSNSNEIADYLLITGEKFIAKGYITNAEEFTGVVESNDGRTLDEYYSYSIEYEFITNNGVKIENKRAQCGELPLEKQLNDIPYEIEIEYLPERPFINRVKGLLSNNETLWEWFRHEILIKLFIFSICLVLTIIIVKNGVMDYRAKIKNLEKTDYR